MLNTKLFNMSFIPDRRILFYFIVLIASIYLSSCRKELPPKPDNYEDYFRTDAPVDVTIPCEDDLQNNRYTMTPSVDGFSNINVYRVSGSDEFDTYVISASHYSSNTILKIEIEDKPGSFLGRKVYNVSQSNYCWDNYARLTLEYEENWETRRLEPLEDDKIYIDFTDTSLNVSICQVRLGSSFSDATTTLTGKVILKR